MNKIYLLIASVIMLCPSAYPMKGGAFRSLEDLCSCKNLLIIQVPNSYQESPPFYETESAIAVYSVQVLKDLRSKRPVGETVAVSVPDQLRLKPGSRYLMAGKAAGQRLLFHWQLGVVEIPASFKLSELDGKDIPSQVTALLSTRRNEIQRQLKEQGQEKEAIDNILPEQAPNQPSAGDGK